MIGIRQGMVEILLFTTPWAWLISHRQRPGPHGKEITDDYNPANRRTPKGGEGIKPGAGPHMR